MKANSFARVKERVLIMLNLETARHFSQKDLEVLGLGQVAYVRPVTVDGQNVWAVHAANGLQVALMPSIESAWAALRQHDLDLVAVN